MAITGDSKIIFRKQDTIGVNDAHDDKKFLLNCFVDLGDLEMLEDFSDPRCLIIGRTGAGKTALLTKLQDVKKDKVIVVDAEALAMNYISNSTIVMGLIDLDIDLNTFFKYLWRHVICVEILTRHLKITSESDHEGFVERVRSEFKKRNPKHLKALDYLEQWKDSFWKTSDSHVSEMTSRLENRISAGVGVGVSTLKSQLQSGANLSTEEKIKIKERGQSIVNDTQMQDVTGLLEMMDDFIDFHMSRYYVVIDKLDEKWVGNSIRYRLIKSLIETTKDLNRLKNIKPIATLRYDLIGRVFDATMDTGFQQEKFNSLFLNIHWSKAQLMDLIDKRINYLFKLRYSKRSQLTIAEIFPDKIDNEPIADYLVSRTLMRPRDLIEFVNICIRNTSQGDGSITIDSVKDAERIYSRSRLDSLNYEWSADYPGLKDWAKLLSKMPSSFKVSSVATDKFLEKGLNYANNPEAVDIDSSDTFLNLCKNLINKKLSDEDFKKKIIYIFYRVSLVGLREQNYSKVNWSHAGEASPPPPPPPPPPPTYTHPCFQSSLKISS